MRPQTSTVNQSYCDQAPTAAFASSDLLKIVNRFANRELSWLDFNSRVLALAASPNVPLLERLKFLAIFATNLDEFYMVRVAGLKRRLRAGLSSRSADGLNACQQLDLVATRASTLMRRHAQCLHQGVLPPLAKEGVRIALWADLDAHQRRELKEYFLQRIFPVLTPLAVDAAHPFPYISGLSLNLAVITRDPQTGIQRFARVKIPNNMPRFLTVEPNVFLPVEALITVHIGRMFPGLDILECHLFRVTRDADLDLDEDGDEDLLQALERELARRRFGSPVRLEVAAGTSAHVLELLTRELDIEMRDTIRVPGLLDLSALWQIYAEVHRTDLKDPPFVPATHPALTESGGSKDIFAVLRSKDILLHHPYHSFTAGVQEFIEQAASDPAVLAIKMTLYRTSGNSPIVDTLVAAARAGKQVVVLVEVKARFDERANIGWARTLERAGCHVAYGIVGLKTHCKTALVIRRENDRIQHYCHIGTGNYHPKTARLYEDFGLLTSDPEVGADLIDLFNSLTGRSRQTQYRRLIVAPHSIRDSLIELINSETIRAENGEGFIQIKVNSLADEAIADALYRASQAGVRVDLIVRGICILRPGIPELSENIRVRSILGRFLEHSRVFRFGSGHHHDFDAEFWMGSADLMRRNLDRRVEALVRITDPAATNTLHRMFTLCMSDDIIAFDLHSDGSWRSTSPRRGARLRDVQERLLHSREECLQFSERCVTSNPSRSDVAYHNTRNAPQHVGA